MISGGTHHHGKKSAAHNRAHARRRNVAEKSRKRTRAERKRTRKEFGKADHLIMEMHLAALREQILT